MYDNQKSPRYDSQSNQHFVITLHSLFQVTDILVKSSESVCVSIVYYNKMRHIDFIGQEHTEQKAISSSRRKNIFILWKNII